MADIFSTPTGSSASSESWPEPLTVVRRTYPLGADLEAILAGKVRAEIVCLSSDGRAFLVDWHRGPVAEGRPVYVEIRRRGGHDLHAWVDPVSRKFVQVG